MAEMLSFRASSHEYLEKFNTSAALTMGASQQDASPAQNSVQSYGFLRRIRIRLRNQTAGSGGGFNADYPPKILSQVALTDPNGAEIYGGPTWSGYETFLAEKYGAYKAVNVTFDGGMMKVDALINEDVAEKLRRLWMTMREAK